MTESERAALCLSCTLPICDDRAAECAFVQIKRKRGMRGPDKGPRFSHKTPPPDLTVEIEYSGEYRAWVRQVLSQ